MTQAVAKTTIMPAVRPDSADAMLLAVLKTGNTELAREIIKMRNDERAANALIAFNNAFADAKAEIGTIIKNRRVFYKGKDGKADTDYMHEDLGGIADAVKEALANNGLSYRWDTEQREGGAIWVTCIVSHRDGHSIKNSLFAGRDTGPGKGDMQALGSTITYLQRYTLKAALGLAAAKDDDGQAGSVGAAPQYVTTEQLAELNRLADELNVDKVTFCRVIKVESLAHIAAKDFAFAVATMETKRGRKGSK
jgi:hypothetical protein